MCTVINNEEINEIYQFLYNHCKVLSYDGYNGQRGTSSKVLIGPNNINKYIALINFIQSAIIYFPNVILIYISCKDSISSGFANSTLIKEIEDYLLNNYNIYIRKERKRLELSLSPIIEALNKVNKYIFLIIDDLDMLYKNDSKLYPGSLITISELSGIGNTPYGRIATILYSSSLNLEALITTNITNQLKLEYPLLNGAINLNITKFEIKRMKSMKELIKHKSML
jgi:hypothetical protein